MYKNVEVIDFLKENGYTDYHTSSVEQDVVWNIYKNFESEHMCISNEKVPQLRISRINGNVFHHEFDYLRISICGKINLCSDSWLNANFDFTVDEAFDNIADIERRMIALWNAVNQK